MQIQRSAPVDSISIFRPAEHQREESGHMPNKPPASDDPGDALNHGPHDGYVSALSGRYASRAMQRLWSDRHKFETWRRIWLAVAEAQHEMGLPVTKEQVEELRANLDVTDADIALAQKYEAELRHDVMSHVHAWGDRCPKARGIIHLGMTSQDINDNCELLAMQEARQIIEVGLVRTIGALADFARRTISIPTLGFTHYQPAQPVTVGRRAAQWAHDLSICLDALQMLPDSMRGLRGATGTQAALLNLAGDHARKVDDVEARFLSPWFYDETADGPSLDDDAIRADLEDRAAALRNAARAVIAAKNPSADAQAAAEDMEEMASQYAAMSPDEFRRSQSRAIVEDHTFSLVGQTYPRVVDAMILGALANICAVLHKVATDIRLLCNLGEVSEPFAEKQIGSSAMPYKRNPMRCERVCGLARFVWNLVPNAYDTAATQWLERTLDDSSNRRLTLPQAFLATEACLNIMHNVASGLVVHEKVIARNLQRELPFLATEAIMMRAVALGRDRQDVHEAIRRHAMQAKHRMVEGDGENDLVERLKSEPLLEGIDIDAELVPERHIGLSIEQTDRFLNEMRDQIEDSDPPEDLRV